ncbi:hypothetical protein ACIA8K_10625 [Catenuloplanes sp. NPDC051500]|uniref:hypothetical protein n=1 Tax=Catenuloplanes sp. NPDC051500 TaxID=3363959 RepID=UPI0037953E9D
MFTAVGVVAVEPLLCLFPRDHQKVGAEELDEPCPVSTLMLPRHCHLVRVPEHRFRRTQRHVQRESIGDVPFAPAENLYRPAQHPLVTDSDQPGDDERVARHLLEHGRAHVRSNPIGQVVDEALHQERGPVLALHLERALHHVAPAEHHLPFGLRQVRPGLDELLHHRPAVRQPVLQHETVPEQHPPLLIGVFAAVAVLGQKTRRSPVVAGLLRKRHQLALEVTRPSEQRGIRHRHTTNL